jgi:hypothetical protein
MTAIGINNKPEENVLFVVGNGNFYETSPNAGYIDFGRTHAEGESSNAFMVKKDGSAYISKDAHISGSAHINRDLYVNGENIVDKINNIASSGGNGTVTSITAGDGLTGGIKKGEVTGTISLSETTKASLKNADSAIQTVTSQSDDYITVSNITKNALTIQATKKLTDAVALAETALQTKDIADKADKVTGAIAGNFAGLDADGNLVDSGKKSSHFAAIDHVHNGVYKTIQGAVEKTGAADKTLTISQNANGVIDAKEVDIAITHDQVTDFDTAVTGVVNNLGITTEGIDDLGERLTTAESEIDTLQTAVTTTLPSQINDKVDKTAYNEKVAALEKADTNLDTAVKAAQADATSAKKAIEAFLKDADITSNAVDTLKEIQEGLDAGEASAASLLAEVNKIKKGTTVVPKAADADTVDGKHADEFATAAQGEKADSAVQSLSGKKDKQSPVSSPTADGTATAFIDSISQNENGKITVTKKNVNFNNYVTKN